MIATGAATPWRNRRQFRFLPARRPSASPERGGRSGTDCRSGPVSPTAIRGRSSLSPPGPPSPTAAFAGGAAVGREPTNATRATVGSQAGGPDGRRWVGRRPGRSGRIGRGRRR